jgi:N,N'-diacetyllegionaminate synthase
MVIRPHFSRGASRSCASLDQKAMKIRTKLIGIAEPAYIIAEIGMNHNGELNLAKRHIELAASCGVSAVKFQTFKAENLFVPGTERFNAMKKCELPFEWHRPLIDVATGCGVDFISSAFGREEADFLVEIGVPSIKVASCDLNNLPFLTYLAEQKKPMLVSTGYASLDEIDKTVELLKASKCPFILLHCVASYPTKSGDENLKNISALRERYDVLVGLSDHSMNQTSVPAAARALGACIFEKHFTIDRTLSGFDHAMSADPPAMKQYVETIRQTELALGMPRREVYYSELVRLKNARRGLYWKADKKVGDMISESDIGILRPSTDIRPCSLREFIGKKLAVAVRKDTAVSWDAIGIEAPE